ncbi:MAG: NAD(P)H-hydrate dehydratase [Verrucomicrobiales bacterium]|nr:NAD(P)H-hydrate dehydratase [Verrucomicrobiales bacterium]
MPAPVVTVEAMRAWEARTWAAGVDQAAVIRRAGLGVAGVAAAMASARAPVLILAGHGHNGDDAEVAGGALEGRAVTSCRLRAPESFAEARDWLARHRGRMDALVVDGMFGIGLNRAPEGAWATLVDAVNGSGIPVLAVDVPSGLDADTGRVLGIAVKASVTVTLGAVKRGLLEESASDHVGRLEVAHEIGLVPWDGASLGEWIVPADFVAFPPRRAASSHKGSYGHVVVVAGSRGYHGAAVLAARAAGRARPGLVTVVTEERTYVPVAAGLQSAMVRDWTGEAWDGFGATALVVGPGLASAGLSPAWRAEFLRVWHEATCPVVVDASALDWLPADSPVAGMRVVTPHPGEAGRMLGRTSHEVQSDRVSAALGIVGRWAKVGVWVVLKGRHTLVVSPQRTWAVNGSGNPGLAQGGTGDVLAGYLGGWLAQPGMIADPGPVLRHAVWKHGAVADRLEASGDAWTAEDLAVAIGSRCTP